MFFFISRNQSTQMNQRVVSGNKKVEDNYYKVSKKIKVDKNTYQQKVNGENYIIKYTDDGFRVTKPNGEVKTFDYNQRCATLTEDQLDDMKDFFEEQNALILADLSAEAASFRYYDGFGLDGYYEFNTETINADEDIFLHELGHAIDFHNNTRDRVDLFCGNKDYIKAFETEYKTYLKEVERTRNREMFLDGGINANTEMFAECAALIMSGGEFDRNRAVIEKYFPQTLALTRKYLDEAHKKSQNVRNPFTSKSIKLPDGKVECLLLNNKGQKVKKSLFDPKKWPACVDEYQAKFNSKGQIVEEVISFPNKFTDSVGKYTHRKIEPNTGKVISETTKKGFLEPKRL